MTGVREIGGLDEPVTLAQMLDTGATYRVLDWWVRRGWIGGGAPGSGQKRAWTERDRRVAALIVKFRDAGFRTDVAAGLAQEAVADPYRMTMNRNGVQIMWEETVL